MSEGEITIEMPSQTDTYASLAPATLHSIGSTKPRLAALGSLILLACKAFGPLPPTEVPPAIPQWSPPAEPTSPAGLGEIASSPEYMSLLQFHRVQPGDSVSEVLQEYFSNGELEREIGKGVVIRRGNEAWVYEDGVAMAAGSVLDIGWVNHIQAEADNPATSTDESLSSDLLVMGSEQAIRQYVEDMKKTQNMQTHEMTSWEYEENGNWFTEVQNGESRWRIQKLNGSEIWDIDMWQAWDTSANAGAGSWVPAAGFQ